MSRDEAIEICKDIRHYLCSKRPINTTIWNADLVHEAMTTAIIDMQIVPKILKELELTDRINGGEAQMKIKIKYFDDELERIDKIDIGDWIDLRAAETVDLKPGEFKLINLGVGMKLPEGYEAHVVPRSSTFKNFGIIQTNHMGVIDESYCGDNDQWKFPALAMRETTIQKGDRICQFRIMKKQPEIEFEVVDRLENKSRNGFGSTGIR